MSAIDEAKAKYRIEKAKLLGAFNAIIGARATLAVLTLFMIGFGSQLLYSPTSLPPVGGLSWAQAGLPTSLDFGEAGRLAGEAKAAAQRENAPGQFETLLNENRHAVPFLNGVGLGVCFLLLIWNMYVNAKNRRYRSAVVTARDAAAQRTA